MSNVGSMTLMSHFAQAENTDGVAEPMQRIEQAAEGLDCPRSLANSAATLWHPETHFDWVARGLYCTAHRRQVSGRTSPTAA
jgi:alanine racemase